MNNFASLLSLKKWKSLSTFSDNEVKLYQCGRHRTLSESSVEPCVVNESDSDEDRERSLGDSGIGDKPLDGDVLSLLEWKIDKLNDMFVEQCRQLATLKEELQNSKMAIERSEYTNSQLFTDMMKKAITQRIKEVEKMAEIGAAHTISKGQNSRAQSLLDAIEFRKSFSLDKEIKAALTNFMQSEELKDQMVQATVESVRDMVGQTVSCDVSSLYLPILERSHRRLIGHITRVVEDTFLELEENSALLSKSVHKATKTLRRALDRHQCLLAATADPGKNLTNTLQCTVEELLHKELKQWRQKVLDILSSQLHSESLVETETPSLEYTPISPLQPPSAGTTIIDQLMKTAEINKKIQDGDINGSFEKALSASDLSLVMAACRAAEPMKVFTPPCCLELPVILSLVQQLATDMVHETQLKCRYLEDAIICLNNSKSEIQAHLPLVVGELRKHLANFLTSYPSHIASRRISLIIMAADNLLK